MISRSFICEGADKTMGCDERIFEFLDEKEELDERQYEIMVLRYGIKSGVPLAQREVASLLKISRSYVSRIEKSAIEKLREYF